MNTFFSIVLYLLIGGLFAGINFNGVYDRCHEYQDDKREYAADLFKDNIVAGALWPLMTVYVLVADMENLETCKTPLDINETAAKAVSKPDLQEQ